MVLFIVNFMIVIPFLWYIEMKTFILKLDLRWILLFDLESILFSFGCILSQELCGCVTLWIVFCKKRSKTSKISVVVSFFNYGWYVCNDFTEFLQILNLEMLCLGVQKKVA